MLVLDDVATSDVLVIYPQLGDIQPVLALQKEPRALSVTRPS